MSRGKALTLGFFTAWPFLYMILFMCAIFGTIISGFSEGANPSGPPLIILIIFPLHFLTMLDVFVLMVIYIVHVFNTDRVLQNEKALWAVILFFGNLLAMPVYWYLYIWKQPKEINVSEQSESKGRGSSMPYVKCPSCGGEVEMPEQKSNAGKLVGCLIALVAVPFVVAVIGLLTAIAIPAFLQYRMDARETMCQNNLTMIYAAKEVYQSEKGLPDGADVKREDLIEYTEVPNPICPAGGEYTVNGIGINPTCTEEKHRLPM